MKTIWAALGAICLAGAAIAHGGVKDKTVLARMDGMKSLADNVRVLGDMAKGKTTFDADAAAAARTALIQQAALVTQEFEPPAQDPKSEALPEIWTNWDGFARDARALEQAIETLNTSSLDDVRAGLGAIGKSCSSCHETYRLEK